MRPVRIALSGKMGSGKSTAAEMVATAGAVRVSFAEPLRTLYNLRDTDVSDPRGWLWVASLFQPPEHVHVQDAYTAWRDAASRELLGRWTRRQFFQQLGMHYRGLWPDVWVECLLARGAAANPDVTCVVDDLRFGNEATALRGADFALVRCVCPDELMLERLQARDGSVPPTSELHHVSETELDHWSQWDYQLDTSGTVDELRPRVQAMIEELTR
ncbi:MAG: hypothetical protein GYA36_21115 [Veillonellaceae bacterium]|nr:hypothetical protein [Veillonellaceae bacterium]